LQALAELKGISLGFNDVFGDYHPATAVALNRILTSLGCDVTTPEAVEASLHAERTRQAQQPVQPVLVWRDNHDDGHNIPLNLPNAAPHTTLHWQVAFEDGGYTEGSWQLDSLSTNEAGHRLAPLPMALPWGYHTLTVQAHAEALPQSQSVRILRSPEKAYMPERLRYNSGAWGPAVQLYSLRSNRNLGVGDVTDLHSVLSTMAQKGAGFVGLNPLHELFPTFPDEFSPYSPSSRKWFNSLIIDVSAVAEFAESPAAQQRVASPAFMAEAHRLRELELVDYPAVAKLKRAVIADLFETFYSKHYNQPTARGDAFAAYVASRGDSLRNLAVYQALHEHRMAQDASQWGWPVWPAEYQRPDTPAVEAFAQQHAKAVTQAMYTQWITEEQLASLGQACATEQLPVGLYLDLAVGANIKGVDVWCDQDAYCLDQSVGAPPDAFNQLGQNWGLPALNPHALRQQGYTPFIEMLRANMRYAGALRLDHALSVFRIFWVPQGETGVNGAYVNVQANELLAILAIESHRHQCLVIGEDLGTIPDYVFEGLSDWGLLSYKVFTFEQNGPNGGLSLPEQYPWLSLVTVSTHDLPTLEGFWCGDDIALRQSLNLFPSAEKYQEAVDARPGERQAVINVLLAIGAIDEAMAASINTANHPNALPEAIRHGVHRHLASTPARLQAVQLEDLLGVREQMNMPGTTTETPNWRRKLPVSVADLATHETLNHVLATLRTEPNRQVWPPQAY
jgi:4-alpha-glucanotransferase